MPTFNKAQIVFSNYHCKLKIKNLITKQTTIILKLQKLLITCKNKADVGKMWPEGLIK